MPRFAKIHDASGDVVNISNRVDDAVGFTFIHEEDWTDGREPYNGERWLNKPELPATFGFPEAVDVSGDLAGLSVGELVQAQAESAARQKAEAELQQAISAALNNQLGS